MAARDVLIAGIIIFSIGVTFLAIHFMTGTVVDKLLMNAQMNSSATAVDSISHSLDVADRLDGFTLYIMVGYTLAIIITSYFIGGHPIFMFIYFLFNIIAVVISIFLSNIWEDLSSTSVLSASASSFTITNHIMSKLPIYVAIIGFIGLVIMYAKPTGIGSPGRGGGGLS